MEPYSIYLHIPFCRHRCSYCDFNTYTGLGSLIPDYIQALCAEIRFIGRSLGEKLPVHSIFLGGGTPSLIPLPELTKLFEVLDQEFDLLEGLEISLEANPEGLTQDYVSGLHKIGINRISLGVQSADPVDLRLLERHHDFPQASQAVRIIRKAGFENLNLDLIFSIPQQSLQSWKKSLGDAIKLRPDHFSLYALTLEVGTPMAQFVSRGFMDDPDPDLAADMYLWASEELDRHGFRQYEISNWARLDASGDILSCKHNLQYWHNRPYLGLGAGAHGYAAGMRTANTLSPRDYIERCLSKPPHVLPMDLSFPMTPATDDVQALSTELEMSETMMMGLRLTEEGVSRAQFRRRFNQELDQVFRIEIEQLVGSGLLEWDLQNEERIRLTARGRLLGNQVFMRFV